MMCLCCEQMQPQFRHPKQEGLAHMSQGSEDETINAEELKKKKNTNINIHPYSNILSLHRTRSRSLKLNDMLGVCIRLEAQSRAQSVSDEARRPPRRPSEEPFMSLLISVNSPQRLYDAPSAGRARHRV